MFPSTVNAQDWPRPASEGRARPVAVTSSTVLDAALRLHEALAVASDVGAALALVRRSLGDAMGAQGSVCLLPLPTRDGSVVLQGVEASCWSGREQDRACLDLGACATVLGADASASGLGERADPLLRAIVQGGVQLGGGAVAGRRWPWRAGVAGDLVVLPLVMAGRREPVGLIEWHGVGRGVETWLPVLASAARLLSQALARRGRGADAGAPAQALLVALTEALPISVLVLNADTLQVQALNWHAEMELGVQRDAALGQPLGALVGEAALAAMLPRMQDAAQRDSALEHDVRWASAEGERLISARHVAVRDEQGQVRWLICQWRDVTDRRHAERSLTESQMRFKELVESIEEGVFVSDPERTGLEYASARALDMLGLGGAGAVVTTAEALARCVVPEDRALLAAVASQEQALQGTDCRLRIQHPARGLRWLRQRTQPRLLPDGRVRVVALVDDVTDEHERAQQLQGARDAAEAASQAKSHFMATMSHEIRTPMNGILGMTELLLGTRLGEKQRRFAQAVYRSAENLLEIINDVLDVAKIEAGRLELAPTELSLRALVEDTLELLAPRAHEKGLELSFREAAGVPDRVRADPLRLRQVLTNLVGNAVKFTERGEVNIELACLLLTAQPRTVQLEFSVRDTGIGIAPDEVPRLFNAFSQAHGGMARRYGGTGLGLAIARQLVELMGGRITLDSQVGRGSLFRFTIPVEDVTPTGLVQRDSPDMPRLRVLLVEDHPTSRQVLESMLREWGLDVTVALDGRQALLLLHARRHAAEGFDLALVDWRMPGLDGIEFARAVMAEHLQPGMKLVLLSSMSAPDDLRAAREAGYRRFVQKPVRKSELREALLGLTQPDASAQPSLQLDSAVLVVEDNQVNQEVMQHMLVRLGCTAQVAASAAEGLAALQAQRFDAVLMDIQMPDMDGIEALQVLRTGPGIGEAWATSPGVPVIAVTANTLPGDEARLVEQGFDGYLPKPYRQSDLMKILLACQGEAWQSEFAGLEDGPGHGAAAGAAPPPRTGVGIAPSVADQNGDGLPILDPAGLARLHGLESGGQNQLFERVVGAFENTLDRMSVQLDQGIAEGDARSVGQVVHTLKSSSANVGATRLAQLSAHLEGCLRAGAEVRALAAPLGRLQDEIRLARDWLALRLTATGRP